MSEPASQIFFHLARASDGAVYAYETPDGPTVPFFSSMTLARAAIDAAGLAGIGVGVISPTQMSAFSASCLAAGARFLQLDPLPQDLASMARYLGG